MASKTSLLVAAIDVGTTYSGWAFSFRHEYFANPTNIRRKLWSSGKLVSEKAPTTILIKPDGKTLDSFGYDAETKHAALACDDSSEYKQWYYFRLFKMMLHGKMTFDRNTSLEDETHKSLPALTVFSLVIRYLKEDSLNTIREHLCGGCLMEDDITWVLTVPTMWNDAPKQFMREAAVEAGIKSANLRIALEPETASIYCRLLPAKKMIVGGGISSFKPGSKYMVVNAGGGIVDIIVHEVMPGGTLKEIHKASGGALGGIQIDEAFEQFIINLVGNPVFYRFQTENKSDYLTMLREFEIIKRNIAPGNGQKVTFHVPSSLKKIFEEEADEDFRVAIKQTKYADKISLGNDKLRVDDSVMENLFSHAVQNIVSHLRDMMNNSGVRGISSILMVGGVSESMILQGAIRSNFPHITVIVPEDPSFVVLQGAVIFGHSPFSIVQRVCKYTYGVAIAVPFDDKIHDPAKRIQCEDGPHCDDIFSKHVEIGQPISLNETTEEKAYFPLEEKQRSVTFHVYASTSISPMYVTDAGCVKLGKVEVDIQDISVPRKERSVLVSMTFGGTEIEVEAREKRTGKITKSTVDFLE